MTTFAPAQPTTIATLEDGAMARLAAIVTPQIAAIESFPAKPEKYEMKHQAGALLVACAGESYDHINTSRDGTANRTLMLDVACCGRGLDRKGHRYAASLAELAIACLAGFRVDGFDSFIPIRTQFSGSREGMWVYNVRFEATTMFVPFDNDGDLGPLLEQITIDGPPAPLEIPPIVEPVDLVFSYFDAQYFGAYRAPIYG